VWSLRLLEVLSVSTSDKYSIFELFGWTQYTDNSPNTYPGVGLCISADVEHCQNLAVQLGCSVEEPLADG
jgi:hypothetical protein